MTEPVSAESNPGSSSATTPGRIAWDGGGDGRLVRLDGEAIVVRSSRAFAPGSRPCGRIAPSGSELRMKTHRCRRIDDADGLAFTVEGRTLDVTREVREELLALSEPVTRSGPSTPAEPITRSGPSTPAEPHG